jgi:polysaccharide chain length determinant protein (PEP-CTERM system associated)
MEALAKAQGELSITQRRREELQRQLRGEQPLLNGADPTPGSTRSTGGSTAISGSSDNDTASGIREAQARLDDLLLRFTDRHPDVIALKSTLEKLKARQQTEIDAVKRGDPGAAARMGLDANPVFQSIQLQLNQTDVDAAALRGTIADHQKKIASLQRLVDTAPEVEAQFARLNRDYTVTRAQYQALVEQLERARLSEQAEENGIVRFEIIDPPTAGFKPVAPNRPLLIVAILIAGLAAGGGLAYLLHLLKPVFANVRQLNEITGLPVLGVVSMTWLEKHQALQRREAFVCAGVAGVLLLVGGVMLLVHAPATHLLLRWMS